MRVFKYGKLFETFYPNRTWSIPNEEKVIYLTFDDGPVPEATPWVLDQLDKYQAKATFFMVGDNVKNHCRTKDYLDNVKECQSLIEKDNPRKLFRPPYGRMNKKQVNALKEDYQIIMWSVLTYDFDDSLSAKQCLEKAISLTKSGSIVLMHDSVKTIKKLEEVLPSYLEYFTKEGYAFKCL